MNITFIIIFGVIACFELTALIKKRNRLEIILYSTLMFCVILLFLLRSFNIQLPSPAKPIEAVVKGISSR